VVSEREKESDAFIEYDLDDDTGYRSPKIQAKGPRVLLD
jgi:hypothetical protein